MSEVKELPKGWEYMRLGDLAKRNTGKVLPSDHPNLKFIGMDCIEPHTLRPTFLYDFKEFKSSGNSFKKNQVLYGRMRPYLNKVFKADFDGACSGEFIVLDCNKLLLPDLLKYILHSRGFVSFANSITTGDRPRISYDEIAEYQIAVSPIPTQAAIVSKIEELFSELDKGIESLRTAQQQLRTYRQSVLKWAFEGRLTRDDVKDGELPEGWTMQTLKELKLFSIYGPRFSSGGYVENGVAVLRTTDIDDRGKVDWENSPKLDLSDKDYEKYKLIKNDLLITRTGSIGRLSVFNDDKKAIPGAFLIHYRLRDDVNVWYVFNFLQSQAGQKHLKAHSFGVGRPNLNVPNIELLQIPIPSPTEQNKILEEIESRFSVVEKMEESISQSLLRAEALRQSILKMAFEGRLVE